MALVTAMQSLPHDDACLLAANACHPELPDDRRRDMLLDAASRRGDEEWKRYLARRHRAPVQTAMRMLSQWETPVVSEGYRGTDGTRRCPMLVVVVGVLIVLLLLCLWVRKK